MSLAARRRRWLVAASLTLLVLLALIATVVINDRTERAPVSLIPHDPLQLVIRRPGRADIVLDRADPSDDWRIIAPCTLPVDLRRLSPLFEALAGGGPHYPRDEVDLVGAGLQPPLATLLVDDRPLQIGGADLSGTRRYLATPERVHLVPEWLWALVNGGLSALATPEVFPQAISAIERVDDKPAGDLSDDVERWNALQAVQIVAWPLVEVAGEPAPEARRYALSITFEQGERMMGELVVTDLFEALVRDGAGCAHLLAPGTLTRAAPASASPDNPPDNPSRDPD